MTDGERERPIEKYGKKEQKEWLDNTLPDPHPCTAGNKEEEHKAGAKSKYMHLCACPVGRTGPLQGDLIMLNPKIYLGNQSWNPSITKTIFLCVLCCAVL